MEIRRYRHEDCKELMQLFYDTVHTVCAKDYTVQQLNAWADGLPPLEEWNRSLQTKDTLVSVESGQLVGFGDITKEGYLDHLYVHRDFQGQGIGGALCDQLEAIVHVPLIFTNASITARPFFERRGYQTIQKQSILRKGILLYNFRMEKVL